MDQKATVADKSFLFRGTWDSQSISDALLSLNILSKYREKLGRKFNETFWDNI